MEKNTIVASAAVNITNCIAYITHKSHGKVIRALAQVRKGVIVVSSCRFNSVENDSFFFSIRATSRSLAKISQIWVLDEDFFICLLTYLILWIIKEGY